MAPAGSSFSSSPPPGSSSTHPLDPLTPGEVAAAAAACRAHAAEAGLLPPRFNTVALQEPPKAALLAFRAGRAPAPPRAAFCILQTYPPFTVHEALVTLAGSSGSDGLAGSSGSGAAVVASWRSLDGAGLDGQPLATPDDCLEAEAIARADADVARLLAERGVALARVACDPWAIHACPARWRGRRLMQVFMYLKLGPDDNEYARPLDLAPVCDLHERRVIHIDHYDEPPTIPAAPANYHPALLDRPLRAAPKPLHISQPLGPTFTVDGWHVRWQKWDFRIGFNGREGLVLHDVCYTDDDDFGGGDVSAGAGGGAAGAGAGAGAGGAGAAAAPPGRRRPVLWRGAIAEMAVPYADPRAPYMHKCALDAGDYGLGFAANSLVLGCDCLGEVQYFDAVVNDSKGAPVVIKNAVCLHEEDSGILWKHLDYRTGRAEVRRGRRLVVQFIMTAVNYDYLFNWHLYLDGAIGCEVKLTGILSTSLLSPGEPAPTHGVLVAPGVNAAAHQHLFCARLDLAVDDDNGGRNLVVSELNARQQPTGPDNVIGNAFVQEERDLTHTHAAQRLGAPETNRVWRVKNPARLHPGSNQPVAYHLYPAAGPVLLAQPDSAIARRAAFTTRALWVTPHSDGQLYPAGAYVFQSSRDAGLGEWTKQDRSLLSADPVVWHTFGVTHFVRPEDYPIMPCDVTGFMLKPVGFFRVNPSLDVPPEDPAPSQQHGGSSGGAACCDGGGGADPLPNVSSNLVGAAAPSMHARL